MADVEFPEILAERLVNRFADKRVFKHLKVSQHLVVFEQVFGREAQTRLP